MIDAFSGLLMASLLVILTKHGVLSLDCNLYKNRSYISEREMMLRRPPLLMSFPGSGNSWTRMLIEFATGAHTGSILPKDKGFRSVYTSEIYCGLRQVAIKAHPSFVFLRKDDNNTVTNPFEVDLLLGLGKCKKGLIHSFKRVLLLIRDPFDAIVANYNLERTGMNHSGVMSEDKLQMRDFVSFFNKQALGFNVSFHAILLPMIRQRDENNNTDIHVAMYADLVNMTTRYGTMEEVVTYLKFPIVDRDRTMCAFELAEDGRIHRNYSQPKAVTGSIVYNRMATYHGNSTAVQRDKSCAMYRLLDDFNTHFGFPRYPTRHLTPENRDFYQSCSTSL